jgi:hypothetical protein
MGRRIKNLKDKFSGFTEQIVRFAVTEMWSEINCFVQERALEGAQLTERQKLHVGGGGGIGWVGAVQVSGHQQMHQLFNQFINYV